MLHAESRRYTLWSILRTRALWPDHNTRPSFIRCLWSIIEPIELTVILTTKLSLHQLSLMSECIVATQDHQITTSSKRSAPKIDSAMRFKLFGQLASRLPLAALITSTLIISSDLAQGNGFDHQSVQQKLLETNDIAHSVGIGPHPSSTANRNGRINHEAQLSPVILFPGDGGSRLQAKLNRTSVEHYYCERHSTDWFDLWVNLSLLVPFRIDCWFDNMKLNYNSTTRRTSNQPGVATRVYGFGSVEAVEYIDPARVYGTSYFDGLVRQLVDFGYVRNKNIFGAPYDFRRAPNELADYFDDVKALIERAYRDNGDEPVTFVCHSMGCLCGLYFLNQNTQQWKDTYIRSMISLAGVYAGSVKAMKVFASGDNFGVIVVPSLGLRNDVRTFPSLALLLPSPEAWPSQQVLMTHNDKNYTVNDYREFFNDISYPTGYEMWQDVRNLTSPHRGPGVEVHCLHGSKVATPERLHYSMSAFPDAKPVVAYGDGDGTVNMISLQACLGWADKQKKPVYYRNFSSVDHMTILTDRKVMDYIGEALSKS